MMKKLLILFVVSLLLPLLSFSQPWEKDISDQGNFYSIRKAYLDWYNSSSKTGNASVQSAENDGIDTKFRRWEYIMEPRTYPSGKYPAPDLLLTESKKFTRGLSAI